MHLPKQLEELVEARLEKMDSQLFFSGGHGGHVTYDGPGSVMAKMGGPIDRLFLLRNSGELGGNSGLDIQYGSVDFATGPSSSEIERLESEGYDERALIHFNGNPDSSAAVIRGAVQELGIEIDSVLFEGSVEDSIMRWELRQGDPRVQLPYTAIHLDFELHPALREHFDLPDSGKLAVTGWCKDAVAAKSQNLADGGGFIASQHLGFLRVFF
jgi:hypothetical protein